MAMPKKESNEKLKIEQEKRFAKETKKCFTKEQIRLENVEILFVDEKLFTQLGFNMNFRLLTRDSMKLEA